MNNRILIKMAIVFLVIGFGITFVTFALNNFDLDKLDTSNGTWKEREYEFSEDVENIEVLEVSNDVIFLPSQDENIHISCFESEKLKYKIGVKGKNLKVELVNEKKWYEHLFNIGIRSFKSRDLKIYLPKKAYQKLVLTTVSGDLKLDGFSLETLDLSTTSGEFEVLGEHGKTAINSVSGDIHLKSFKAKDLKIQTTSGDIYLEEGTFEQCNLSGVSAGIKIEECEASDEINIQTISGDVDLKRADAKDFDIETVSGNVKGTIKSEKNFKIEGFGQKNVPAKNSSAGNFYVKTISGKVDVEVVQ